MTCKNDSLNLIGALSLAAALVGCGGETPTPATKPDAGIAHDTASSTADTAATSADAATVPATALARALATLGDRAALTGLRTLVVEATGNSAAYDEGPMPADMPFASADFKIGTAIDLEGTRFKITREATYKLIRPGKMAKYDEIVAGQLGYIVGDERVTGGTPNYVAKMSSGRVAAIRRQQGMLHPHLLLRKLAETDVQSQDSVDLEGVAHDRLIARDPDKVSDIELLINRATGRLAALVTKESDPLRGDVPVRFRYDNWEASGALFFPRRVSIEVGGHPVRVEERTAIMVNPPLGNELFMFPGEAPVFDEPEAVKGAKHAQSFERFTAMGVAPSQEFPHTTVKAVELGTGTGVYHLIGSTHHSLLVDQGKTVVLVEAPNDAARSKAILTWIDKTLPGGLAENKVSHVILTHHHVDHSSGLRTFIAQGATAVVAEESRALWTKVLAAPRTIDPDDLTGKPAPAMPLTTVKLGEKLTIGNVTAHHIVNRHSSDTLVIHVVGAAAAPPVLFISDLYIPTTGAILKGSNFVLWSKDLDDALIPLGLATENLSIVGGHGNVDAMGSHFVVPYSMFKSQLITAMAP